MQLQNAPHLGALQHSPYALRWLLTPQGADAATSALPLPQGSVPRPPRPAPSWPPGAGLDPAPSPPAPGGAVPPPLRPRVAAGAAGAPGGVRRRHGAHHVAAQPGRCGTPGHQGAGRGGVGKGGTRAGRGAGQKGQVKGAERRRSGTALDNENQPRVVVASRVQAGLAGVSYASHPKPGPLCAAHVAPAPHLLAHGSGTGPCYAHLLLAAVTDLCRRLSSWYLGQLFRRDALPKVCKRLRSHLGT